MLDYAEWIHFLSDLWAACDSPTLALRGLCNYVLSLSSFAKPGWIFPQMRMNDFVTWQNSPSALGGQL
jgi:hypothetical protein